MALLANKIALITGANRGIGKAISLKLAAENASLILVARDKASLDITAQECLDAGADSVTCRQLDLSDSEAVERFCHEQINADRVDVLVNNAGSFISGNALDGDPSEWDTSMTLNLLTPMRMTRAFSPAMKAQEWGIIINVGSVAATEGMKTFGAYAASKHGLRGWSLSCYQELREFGIKVVLLNPAFVNTSMTAGIEVKDRALMIQPEDVADAMMLAVQSSPACCPEEINLKLTKVPF